MTLKNSGFPAKPMRDSVKTEAFTITTHHVQIDLADLLSGYDITDQVVILITTPSGRSKRVALNGSFLAPQHSTDQDWN